MFARPALGHARRELLVVPKKGGAPSSTGDHEALTRNAILAALPPEERARLATRLLPVTIEAHELLYYRDEPIEHIYFPTTALASILTSIDDGRVLEVGAVGCESLVGLSMVLEDDVSSFDVIGQVPGHAWRIAAGDLHAEIERGGSLRRVLQRAAQAQMIQAAQTAACNRVRKIDQRTARWLLHSADWTRRESFELTQEFLAYMLGSRRPGVTSAAAVMQRAGLITYHRGKIEILDRPRLEQAACGCYAVIRDAYRRLVR